MQLSPKTLRSGLVVQKKRRPDATDVLLEQAVMLHEQEGMSFAQAAREVDVDCKAVIRYITGG